MIDRTSRDRLALAIRRFVSGHIYNDDLDETQVDWRDRGAIAVKDAAWQLYSDNYQHYATGRHALSRADRRAVARWIVFLHSDQEYLWPDFPGLRLGRLLAVALTFGWWKGRENRVQREFYEAGDFSCWPFVREADLKRGIAAPRLLSGRRTTLANVTD
jgi:hypothetical protein